MEVPMRGLVLLATLSLVVACATADEDKTTDDTVDTDTVDTDTTMDTDTIVDTIDTTETDTVDSDTTADTDTDTCPSALVTLTPADGATDVDTEITFAVVFTEDESATAFATLELAASGVDVPLDAPVWTGFGRVGTVQPADLLARNTDYILRLDWSCGHEDVAFTTTDLGDPVDPADVEGGTYAIDLSTMEITQPIGIGSWLSGLIGSPTTTAAVKVVDIDTVTELVDLELGLVSLNGALWEQDLCVATLPAVDLDYSAAPAWSTVAPSLPLTFGTFTLELLDAELSGIFAPGGDFIGEMRIAGKFDTRPVSTALLSNPGAMCGTVALLSGGSVACVACPGQLIGASCLPLTLENLRAWPAAPFSLTPRTQVQVDADLTCNP